MDRYNDSCTCRFFKTVVNNTPVYVRTRTVKMCANNICSYTKCVIRARDNTEAFRKVLKPMKCKPFTVNGNTVKPRTTADFNGPAKSRIGIPDLRGRLGSRIPGLRDYSFQYHKTVFAE